MGIVKAILVNAKNFLKYLRVKEFWRNKIWYEVSDTKAKFSI